MTIYLDVVFLENVCMNSIILFATGLVVKAKCKFFRIIISGTLGALYVIGKYLGNSPIFSNIFVQIGLAIAMIYIAFKPNNLRILFKYIVIFYLTSFVFGGCAFALLYYVKPQEILYNNGQLTRNISNKNSIFGSNNWANIFKYCFQINKKQVK